MKMKRIYRYSRIIIYIIAFIYLLISEVKEEYSFIFCPSKYLFNIDCYLCGMTRAFILIFHFNIIESIRYNPLVVIYYPLLVLLSIQDTFTIIKDEIKKEQTSSFIEFLVS